MRPKRRRATLGRTMRMVFLNFECFYTCSYEVEWFLIVYVWPYEGIANGIAGRGGRCHIIYTYICMLYSCMNILVCDMIRSNHRSPRDRSHRTRSRTRVIVVLSPSPGAGILSVIALVISPLCIVVHSAYNCISNSILFSAYNFISELNLGTSDP